MHLIENGKNQLAYAANATMTLTYWNIGKRINDEVLDNQRAEYGKKIVVSVARQLAVQYGRSFEEKNLRRMMQFAHIFNNEQIVVSLIRQLSWSHLIELSAIEKETKYDFFIQLCVYESWGVRQPP